MEAREDGAGAVPVIPESLADLLERPLYAHLATVRPDGTPQVNPTWLRFDGEYVWLTATTRRQKHRNWQHQPAIALSITDPDPAVALSGGPRPGGADHSRSGGGGVHPAGGTLWPAAGGTARCRGPDCRGDPARAHHHPVTGF